MNKKEIATIIKQALETGNYQIVNCGFHNNKKKPIDPMAIMIVDNEVEKKKDKIVLTV